MEEQRQRQEDEQRRAQAASADEAGGSVSTAPAVAATSDETMLERVLAISETPVKRHRVRFYSIFKFGLDPIQILSIFLSQSNFSTFRQTIFTIRFYLSAISEWR